MVSQLPKITKSRLHHSFKRVTSSDTHRSLNVDVDRAAAALHLMLISSNQHVMDHLCRSMMLPIISSVETVILR